MLLNIARLGSIGWPSTRGALQKHLWALTFNMVHTEIYVWNLMTFPWHFKVATAGFVIEKINKMHPNLPSFSGATSYMFYYNHFMKKTDVEGMKNICQHVFRYPFKDRWQKNITIRYEKYLTVSNWYFSMTFNDVQRLFQAKWHQIHPSTKSPLAGTAWNFSQSQARQLCNAGLSVATADKRRET